VCVCGACKSAALHTDESSADSEPCHPRTRPLTPTHPPPHTHRHHVRVYVWVYMPVHYLCVYVGICVCVCVHVCVVCVCVLVCVYASACARVRVCVLCVCECVCACACVRCVPRTCVYACVFTMRLLPCPSSVPPHRGRSTEQEGDETSYHRLASLYFQPWTQYQISRTKGWRKGFDPLLVPSTHPGPLIQNDLILGLYPSRTHTETSPNSPSM
jgi:hypothetical protein